MLPNSLIWSTLILFVNPFCSDFIHACILKICVEFLSCTVCAWFSGRYLSCNGKQTRCRTCTQQTKSSGKYKGLVTIAHYFGQNKSVLGGQILHVLSYLWILNRHTKHLYICIIYKYISLIYIWQYMTVCHAFVIYMSYIFDNLEQEIYL